LVYLRGVISLQDISFEFGGRYLYKEASWHIKPKERIGLIGLNGTGKSTLLHVINGAYSISEGIISKQGGLQIGFLNQDLLSLEINASIVEVAMQAFERQLQLEKEIEEIIHKLETAYTEDLVHVLGDRQHEFENLDGYNIRYKTEEILEGLGFKTSDLNRPLSEFSGGWRMRVMLARMLLAQPELLMLDEPTNHLDLPSIQWLEEYLRSYPGTVIVVSHDRYFLNRICTKMVEIYGQKFHIYEGNYDYFLEEKTLRNDLQFRQFENQQQYIKDQEKFINRFRAKASKATAVQSRVNQLDKLDLIEAPVDLNAEVRIKFRFQTPSGKIVSSFEKLSKSYGPTEIFREITGEIVRGDKIALIGANGLGKSTLLKIIANQTEYTGELRPMYNVNMSFYAQHQLESLRLNDTILEEVMHHAPTLKEVEARTVLGCFLFSGEDVFKKIRVLSGGEKSRVALAKTIVSDANFLLLDEPTNHLDMQSVNILVDALNDYEGTILMVSHDRHFISRIANKIWWIEDHELKEYPGTYDEFEEWNTKRLANKKAAPKQALAAPVKQEKAPAAKQPENVNLLKKLNKSLEECEAKINQAKAEKGQIEKQFEREDILSNAKALEEVNVKYTSIQQLLQKLNADYELLFEEIVRLDN
jgi:ATP-binding cassette subfamily F protein 3